MTRSITIRSDSVYSNFHILSLGTAAVIDIVMLLAVLERRNRRYVLNPVLLLIFGGCLWHAGAFAYAALGGVHQTWADRPEWTAMVVMTFGLLLMPSAMLHCVWRIRRTGFAVRTPPLSRYLWCYLPVVAVVPIAWRLAGFPAGTAYVDRVWPIVPFYGVWLSLANLAAIVGFLRLRRDTDVPHARRFFTGMVATLCVLVVLDAFVLAIALPMWPDQRAGWLLAVMLSPIAPALVFAYYVMRHELMQVVVERTAVYAAIIAGGLLLHELAIRPVTTQLSGHFGLNFAIVEILLVLVLIIAYQPLRQRAAEALRYLMGGRVAPMRDQTRRLAVQLSEHATRPPEETIRWFAPALCQALYARTASIWLFDAAGDIVLHADEPEAATESHASTAKQLRDALADHNLAAATQRDAPDKSMLDCLHEADVALAVLLRHQQVSGLLLVGRRRDNQHLSDEESNAAVLLAEQLAVTLNVAIAQADRLAAERRALQGEKLAMLGLVASSIAHEVKNPLSSIKTIATVLAEDLGPSHPHAEDARLIRDEAERLSATTARLLRFARPASQPPGKQVSIGDVLGGTLHVMSYVARQRGVAIQSTIPEAVPKIAADEDALREIFTNLIGNAIEAAGSGGHSPSNGNGQSAAGGTVSVCVSCESSHIRVVVEDNGPGLPDAVRRRLFEPFVTTRDGGTGLGLYIVGCRVRELGGKVECHSPVGAAGGTRFLLQLNSLSPVLGGEG